MLTLCLALASFGTALLSGIFGMAGGMLLMGLYAAVLPVPTAMVLHSGTQLCANALRAQLLFGDVYWRGVGYYALGASTAFLTLRQVHFVPDPLLVFTCLGLSPFMAALLPARFFDFEQRTPALLCGALVASLQLFGGAAGPLLDLAFVRTNLTRTQVVSTKAITQVFSHSLKLAYFIPLASTAQLTPTLGAALLLATIAGTWSGTRILRSMTDQNFRRYSRAVIYAIGAVYLAKAGTLLL